MSLAHIALVLSPFVIFDLIATARKHINERWK